LILRSANAFEVSAIDIDGAGRLLARAGKADPDVRGFRFAGPVDDAAHDRELELLDADAGLLPFLHALARVLLDLLGQLLEQGARRAAAAGTSRDARREGP